MKKFSLILIIKINDSGLKLAISSSGFKCPLKTFLKAPQPAYLGLYAQDLWEGRVVAMIKGIFSHMGMDSWNKKCVPKNYLCDDEIKQKKVKKYNVDYDYYSYCIL